MNTEQKAKAYDEALDRAKKELQTCGSTDCDAARQIFRFFPTLHESEDERIRKEIIDFIQWAEDRGMTRHDYHQAKRPAVWIAYLEKQKECVADSSKTSVDEDESIRKFLVDYFTSYKIGNVATKLNGVRIDDILNYLEKQKETLHILEMCKENANSFTDGVIEVRSFQRGLEEGKRLERQKENSKSADSISSDCESNAKCENRWHKVEDSLPDSTREVLCKDAIGNYFIGRYYSKGVWEVSMYDDCDKSNEDNPPVVKWCEIPSEKQKEQKPVKMEVYEVGKGTTICGQDYKCKKDYKEGNCRYIKDAIYHCGRDGYLTDQNGVSWSCTPEWFNEYIQSNTEWAEEEKTRFVSGQFLQCKLSFEGFKEGEHYWLEYVGDDMYVGRSDNILNQKFHITPRQLYTLFSQQLEEKQKEQKHPNGCFTCDEYKKGYEEGRRNGFTAGYNKAMKEVEQKEQKPAEYLSKDKVYAIMSKLTKLSTSNLIPFNSPEYKKINEITSDIRSLLDYPIEQKPRWEINNPHTTKWTKEMIDEKFEELVKEYHKQKPVVTHGETYHVDTLGTQQVIAGKMPQKPAEWSKNDNVFLNEITDFFENNTIRLQHDLDMYAHWLKSLPERFNLQPKPEWSEEDTYTLNVVQRIVGQNKPNEIFKIGNKKAISSYQIATWLGTLPERFNLQPKQEQNDYITPHKEFFKFIYDRLINVHKENPNVDYMRSFKERLNNLSFGEKQEWSEEDENKIESIKGLITMGKFVDTNTIKTIWKLLDSLRPQPKVEWSEEDEKRFKRVLEIIDRHGTVPVFNGKVEKRFNAEYIWLKNLRERLKSSRSQPQRRDTYYDIIHGILDMLKGIDFTQITPEHRVSLLNDIRVKCKNADECAAILDEPSWKPSEEQMEALERTIHLSNFGAEENRRKALGSLYEQLKKL